VCWLLKKVIGGLIFGPDFGVSRLTGGAWTSYSNARETSTIQHRQLPSSLFTASWPSSGEPSSVSSAPLLRKFVDGYISQLTTMCASPMASCGRLRRHPRPEPCCQRCLQLRCMSLSALLFRCKCGTASRGVC
jgi:hypothetical protein